MKQFILIFKVMGRSIPDLHVLGDYYYFVSAVRFYVYQWYFLHLLNFQKSIKLLETRELRTESNPPYFKSLNGSTSRCT